MGSRSFKSIVLDWTQKAIDAAETVDKIEIRLLEDHLLTLDRDRCTENGVIEGRVLTKYELQANNEAQQKTIEVIARNLEDAYTKVAWLKVELATRSRVRSSTQMRTWKNE